MSNFIRFSLFTLDALSNIFLIMATNSSKQRRTDKTKLSTKFLKSLKKAILARTLLICLKFPRTPCQRGKNSQEKGLEQQELNLRSMKLSTKPS